MTKSIFNTKSDDLLTREDVELDGLIIRRDGVAVVAPAPN